MVHLRRGRDPHADDADDPAQVYVNASIAIDAARQLFNGLPSFLGMTIAALDLQPEQRVLHVGPGLGYYSAVMGGMVRPGGSVLAVEVDPGLAARARSLVRPDSPVDVRDGNGAGPFTESFDDGDLTARTLSVVAIYSALGLRDATLGTQLAAALRRVSPVVTKLTRRPHLQSETCFLHTPDWCLRG